MSLTFDLADPQQRRSGLDAAASAVRRGDLVVLPTESVYGVGCDAFSSLGVTRLLEAKGRGRDLPLPVLVGTPETLDGLAADVGAGGRALVEGFWPGPLTLVVRAQPSLAWDLGGTGGTVALRMPLHPAAIELLRATGPMAVTSANRAGSQLPRTCAEAVEQLGDTVAVYLDGGPCPDDEPSTVVDLTGPVPRLLRVGAFGAQALREACPDLVEG